MPVKDYGCASQILNIGTEANPGYPEDAELDEKGYAHADIMRIALLVEPGTEGMITPGAVSYTHLDVYKRQPVDLSLILHQRHRPVNLSAVSTMRMATKTKHKLQKQRL